MSEATEMDRSMKKDSRQQAPAEASPPADQAADQAPKAADPRDAEIEKLRAELSEKDNKYKYLYAEFENFRKRVIRERADLEKFGWEPVAQHLLGVADNMGRAFQHLPAGIDKALSEGLQMIAKQFLSTLEKFGVATIDAVGKPFDPNLHEAVGQEPSEQPSGTIVREHAPGYTLHGRLLRPARVVISAGPAKAGKD